MRRHVYNFFKVPTRALLLAFWDYRAEGVENVPRHGGVVLACTHQSHLDPVMYSAALPRTAMYVARKSLFRNRAFGLMIRGFGAVSLDRDATGAAEVRKILEVLEAGAALIVFPEGTRSPDGEIGRLKPGIALIAKRASAPVVPASVDGTFACWPRHRKLFRPGRVRIAYGEPVE
ncbi:MAG: lysophospholipid acyltransferase family protein, partial [Planctomycetota bacterium]